MSPIMKTAIKILIIFVVLMAAIISIRDCFAYKEKQKLYAHKCVCNFGIHIGASRDNIDELKKADEDATIPSIKIYMAESTGEMTLFEESYLHPIFKKTKKLITTHAEDELRRIERLDKFAAG